MTGAAMFLRAVVAFVKGGQEERRRILALTRSSNRPGSLFLC